MYSTLCSLNSTILHFKEHERCPSKLQNFKLQFQECLHFDEVNLLSVCITTWVLYNNNIKRNNCCMVTTSLKRVDQIGNSTLWFVRNTCCKSQHSQHFPWLGMYVSIYYGDSKNSKILATTVLCSFFSHNSKIVF